MDKSKMVALGRNVFLFLMEVAVIPWFFRTHSNYLFFGNVVAVLGLCVMAKRGILEKRKDCLEGMFWLGLAVIMANGWFRYERLLQVFPFLTKLSETTALCIGVGVIALTVLSTGIYKVYLTSYEEEKSFSEKEWQGVNQYDTETVHSEVKTLGSGMKMTTMNEPSVESPLYGPRELEEELDADGIQNATIDKNGGKRETDDNEMDRKSAGRYRSPRLNFGLVVSGGTAVVAILLLVGVILYFLVQNRNALEQLIGGNTIILLLNCTTVLVIACLALCCIVMFVISILKAVVKLMGYTYDAANIKVEAGIESMEGWITALLSIFIFTYFGKATMNDFLNLMSGGGAVVIFLVGLVSLIVVVMFYHCVYKLLGSCIRRNGMIRRYADIITRKLAKSVLDLLEKMADTVSNIPDLYEILVKAVGKGIRKFMEYVFLEG